MNTKIQFAVQDNKLFIVNNNMYKKTDISTCFLAKFTNLHNELGSTYHQKNW